MNKQKNWHEQSNEEERGKRRFLLRKQEEDEVEDELRQYKRGRLQQRDYDPED